MLHKFPSRLLFLCHLHWFLHKFPYLHNLVLCQYHQLCVAPALYAPLSLLHSLLSKSTLWSYSQNKTLWTHILCQRQLNSAVVLIESFFLFVLISALHLTRTCVIIVLVMQQVNRPCKQSGVELWFPLYSHWCLWPGRHQLVVMPQWKRVKVSKSEFYIPRSLTNIICSPWTVPEWGWWRYVGSGCCPANQVGQECRAGIGCPTADVLHFYLTLLSLSFFSTMITWYPYSEDTWLYTLHHHDSFTSLSVTHSLLIHDLIIITRPDSYVHDSAPGYINK